MNGTRGDTNPLVAELVRHLAGSGIGAVGDTGSGTAIVVVLAGASHEGLGAGVPLGHEHELVGRLADGKNLITRKTIIYTVYSMLQPHAGSINATVDRPSSREKMEIDSA